ncbi:MAG: hypothetical protein HFJ18_03180 [Clostridia bacterium]|nr:hypothetical protein [Clostridia bacterium]
MNIYKKQPNTRLRFNILTVIIYIIGITLLLQLFNLQIINGATYREESNTRLTRESTLYAARGNITDSSGNLLATVDSGYSAELYKTKSDNETLNQSILNIINVLEQNQEAYLDTLPIKINPFEFTIKDEGKLKDWKKKYKLDNSATAEDAFKYFKERYEINTDNIADARKIMGLRYRITNEGYSSTKSISIADNLSQKSVSTFSEKNDLFGGLTIVTKANRTYPNGKLASHILGYVGKINGDEYSEKKSEGYLINDYMGRTGVEDLFEKYLKGTNGTRQLGMSVDGTVTEEYIEKEAIQGSTLVLTIDANLQAVTEKALQDTIDGIRNGAYGKKYPATAGAIVVMNVKNGEVLAMASNPDYEPQLYVKGISKEKSREYEETNALFNRAISGGYAPGSTFKMLTAITALQEGKVGIKEKINDSGPYPLGHHPSCWLYNQSKRTHGYLNVTNAIKHSCNYFFYESGYRAGIEQINRYAKYFGLGVKTGIELTNEKAGIIANPEDLLKSEGEIWSVGHTLSASIGQGRHSFTPIQMAKYISTLVNGGERITPTIIKNITTSSGEEISKAEIQQHTRQILGDTKDDSENLEISQENIDVILEGMKDVTSENGGTAYSVFKNFNFTIGGKTGSAQATQNNVETTNACFVGFAPYEEPEIAIAVIIEGGGTGKYAAYAARDVIAQYFGMNEEDIIENVTARPYTEQQT